MTPTHPSHEMLLSMISRNFSRFVFFLHGLYSMSVNVACFLSYTTDNLMVLLFNAKIRLA